MKKATNNTNTNSESLSKKIAGSFRELASALKNGDKIQEKFTCRRIVLDLHPIPYSPESVKTTRQTLEVSQVIFAQFLGVKASTVRAWEQGKRIPHDMACRFMDEIRRDPTYWKKRLKDSISVKT